MDSVRDDSPSYSLAVLIVREALQQLFPEVAPLGGAIAPFGFYYDFAGDRPLDEELLRLLEERVRGLIKADLPVRSMEMVRDNAITFLQHRNEQEQVDLLRTSCEPIVALASIGDAFELSPLPHLSSTGAVGVVALCEVLMVGRHRDGRSVQRIHGVVAPSNRTLRQVVKKRQRAKKNDHRLLGEQLELFSPCPGAEAAHWLWHPKGAVVRDLLTKWWWSLHPQPDYQPVYSPSPVSLPCLEQGDTSPLLFAVRKRHAMLFASRRRSYRELPLRYVEWITARSEEWQSQYCGLLRSASYQVDTVQAFCTVDQVPQELISSLQSMKEVAKILEVPPRLRMVCRQSGEHEEGLMRSALQEVGVIYEEVRARADGYAGPYLEWLVADALERQWRLAALQIDLLLPRRLKLRYQGCDDRMHSPVLVSRTLFGSLERFTALLLEGCEGHLPLWIAPEQVRVLPVGHDQCELACSAAQTLERKGFRVGFDDRNDGLSAKVHRFEIEKVPYALVVGRREQLEGTFTLRRSNRGQVGSGLTIEEIVGRLRQESKDMES